MKRFVFLIFLSLASGNLMAQSYATALGFRFGNDPLKRSVGLTVQQRIFKKITIEGILLSDFRYNHTGHALFEIHQPIIARRLNFYTGAGFSLGKEQSELADPVTKEVYKTYGNGTFGADVILGLEVTLLKFNVSVDYKPNFNLVGRDPWYLGQVGISARTVLVTAAKQNKRWRERAREKKRKERNEKWGESRFLRHFIRDSDQ